MSKENKSKEKVITNTKEFWELSNKLGAEVLFSSLKKMNITSKLISSGLDENGFFIDFEVTKNISTNQFQLIEGKTLKEFNAFKTKLKIAPNLIKFIKITGVSGLTTDTKKMGNRLMGFVATDKSTFDNKLLEIEDRISRDHRKIGKDQEIFFIDEASGKGLPYWLPNGVVLKNIIKDFIDELTFKYDYQTIETPIVNSLDLYKTSGHYKHYKKSMYPEMINQEKEELMLRPMSCPNHIMVYKHKPRSYKELPIRYAEHVKQYRYESSGSLIGLERARSMELTDGHIFIRQDQLESELQSIYNLVIEAIKKFNIKVEYIELALHDPADKKKYHGNTKVWTEAEKVLKKFLDKNKIKYTALKGEAAFYGPKIDLQIKTTLGHNVTISTIQLDFFLPEAFDLTYVDSKNEKVRPIMIHRGIIGTYERFIAILLEQTKGVLPMWLAPKQVTIIPVAETFNKEAIKLNDELRKNKIRSNVNLREDRLSFKIREAQMQKVPIQIILGEEEIKSKKISYRLYGEEKTNTVTLEKFVSFIKSNA